MWRTNCHTIANGLRGISIRIMWTIEFAIGFSHDGFHYGILDDAIVCEKKIKCVKCYREQVSLFSILFTIYIVYLDEFNKIL